MRLIIGLAGGALITLLLLRPRARYYKHRKGGVYRHAGEGRHTETGEELVAYESTRNGSWWFRPREMFYELGRFRACDRRGR